MLRRLATVALALAAAPASALAADRAETFNAPGQAHAIRCVQLAGSSAPLRFADASPTGFSVTDTLSFTDGRCPAGSVRLDLHEVIPSPQGALAFHRGGNGYADAENVKYGELAAAQVAGGALPAPVPSAGGRGAACTLAPGEPPYAAQIRSIPDGMHYKRPQDLANGSNKGSSFMHYGDPGSDQGDRRDIHYSYLLWSFVNVRGGGMVRTLLAPGQVLRACDVAPITMPAWDRSGAVNGSVTARYVRVVAGNGCPLYGWMAWSHSYDSGAAVAHARAATSAPPLDPQPDPACPLAAAAEAPAVVSGDASPATDGSWTLGGTVDSQGAVTSYRFDLGTDPATYGTPTAETAVGAVDAAVAVSAPVGGPGGAGGPLAPATTYHYRLVASSVHGTTYGEDRTFTTAPAPPPPPPPAGRVEEAAAAPPPTTPPVLTRLRMSPASFHRARTRRGAPARIRLAVSAPATVVLSFSRRVAGVRRGGVCRSAPRRGIPRHARRCARWAPVARTMTVRRAATGDAAIGFGGWVARRPLARGSYRLRALPRGAGDLTGTSRLIRFKLR